MISKIPMILLAGLVVLGIYVLPSVVATFAGSHTMERNETAGVGGLMCMDCHTYIFAELNATPNSRNVLQAHRNAAGNDQYVNTTGGDLNITGIANATETVAAACHMCHMMEQDALNIDGSHTKITIRVCTDSDCHGNSSNTGTSAFEMAGGVGGNLSADADAHSGWFLGMENVTSAQYIDEDGANYTSGFYACIACHTHGEMNMNITRPQAFNIDINIGTDGSITIANLAINDTNMSTTQAQREFGTVWS